MQGEWMAKEDMIEVEGVVAECLPNMNFLVTLDNGRSVQAHLCGKMRVMNIRVIVGDRVVVEVSPYDLSKGRIIYRQK